MKNFAFEKTPKPDQKWVELSEDKRKEAIHNQISKDKTFEDFEIHKAFDDGQVIFKVNKAIPSNVRGPLLLDLEEKLKKINMSKKKAEMILDALNNNEFQYIQQLKRKSKKKYQNF